MSDLGGSLGNQSIGEQMQDGEREPVIDEARAALPGEPPVEGAQWDELHRRWEHWDESSQQWVVVGADAGDGVAPEAENPLPAALARAEHHGEELEAAEPPDVVDIARTPEPGEGPPGAQWNEVRGRWERWDEATGAWVEAVE